MTRSTEYIYELPAYVHLMLTLTTFPYSGTSSVGVDGNRNTFPCRRKSSSSSAQVHKTTSGVSSVTSPQGCCLDSPSSVTSDASATWNGIPRVRRKWIDVVEGKHSKHNEPFRTRRLG